MRNSNSLISKGIAMLCLAAGAIISGSCQSLIMPPSSGAKDNESKGTIRISFVENLPGTSTKASIPDTNSFIIMVSSSSGAQIWSGAFNTLPETLMVDPGTYTISAVSRTFTTPLFDAPQYGDTQVAVVKAGQSCQVRLVCSQLNAGIRLNIDPSFLSDYPSGVLFLQSSNGKLMYGYSEKRIAYFLPGTVTLQLTNQDKTTSLFSRKLEAQQILTVNIKTSGSQSSGDVSTKPLIQIEVDTSRTWISETYTIGSTSEKGSEKANALSVAQAREKAGTCDVWVYGYIVGGDLSSSKCSFEAPFTSRTNIAIASKTNCTDKEACLSVQLAKGDIRDEINLVDHEELLGKKIYLKGDIVEAYYGIPGLQCITEYSF